MTIFAPFGDATTIDVTQTTQAVALPTMPSGTPAFALVARKSDVGSLYIKLGSAAVSVTVESGLKIPRGELEHAAIFVVPASETHIAIICDGNNGKVTLQAGAIYSGDTTTIVADDSITDAKLRNSGALSVIGRSANSTGDPADISATAASGAVLRESGSVLGFGTVATAGIANDSVTYAKIQNVSAASRLLGRGSAAGAGDTEEITLGSGLTMTGTSLSSSGSIGGSTGATDNAALRADGVGGATLQASALIIADTTGDLSRSGGGGIDIEGTTTNDDASSTEKGYYFSTGSSAHNANATITVTIASPAVVTWTSHNFTVGAATTAVRFTTTGTLPTGITSGTTYYLKAIDANTFNIASSVANALAGTFINTSGSQSGVHTGDIRVNLTSGAQQDLAGISLEAGDWDINGQQLFACSNSSTTVTFMGGNITTTSSSVDRTFGRRLSYQYGGLALNNQEFTVFNHGPARFSLSATTTIFLVADQTFGVSTAVGSGWLRARRVR